MCKYGTEPKDQGAANPVIYQGDLTKLYNDLKKVGNDPQQALRDGVGGGGLQSTDDLTEVLGKPRNLVPIWLQTLDTFCGHSRDFEHVPEVGTDIVRAVAFNYLVDQKWDALCRCRQPPKAGACAGVPYLVTTVNQLGTTQTYYIFGALGTVGWVLQGGGSPSNYYKFVIEGFNPPGSPVTYNLVVNVPRPQYEEDGNFLEVQSIVRWDGQPDNCAVDDSAPPEIPALALPEPGLRYYFAPATPIILPTPTPTPKVNPVLNPANDLAPPTGKPNAPCVCPEVKPPLPPKPVKEIVEVQGLPGRPGASGAPGLKGLKGDKGDKGDEAKVDFTGVPIPILNCLDDGTAETLETVVSVISGSLGSEAALVGQLFNQLLKIRQEICSEEVYDESPSIIAEGTSEVGNQVSFIEISNNYARLFALRLLEPFPSTVRLYQLGGESGTEGDYGACGLCVQVPGTSQYANYGDRLNVFTPATLIPVPYIGLQVYIRVSLKVGLSWQLWDLGVRKKAKALPDGV